MHDDQVSEGLVPAKAQRRKESRTFAPLRLCGNQFCHLGAVDILNVSPLMNNCPNPRIYVVEELFHPQMNFFTGR
jgi:hypothetical protein